MNDSSFLLSENDKSRVQKALSFGMQQFTIIIIRVCKRSVCKCLCDQSLGIIKGSQRQLQILIFFWMISSLAPRNQSNYLDKCSNTNLFTNLFKVNFKEDTKIYIYAVKTSPEVSKENVKMFRNMLLQSRKIIERLVGTYTVSGRTLFGSKCLSGKDQLNLKIEYEGTPYQIFLKMVKQVAISDIHSLDKRKSGVIFSFLNNMVKNFFFELKYTEIGRSRKYFDAQHYSQLDGGQLMIFKGYSSNFTLLEGGLFLRMDPAFKMVRNETVLQVINKIYLMNRTLPKQQKRLAVESELVGKMVMTNYGKNAYHVIKQINFDTLLDGFSFNNGNQQVSLLQYYKDTYGIVISNKKQPLIKAEVDAKSRDKGKEIILIPELLLMSGLPNNFDQRKRREVSELTIVSPSAKLGEIEDIFNRFNQDSDSFNPNTVGEKLGIKIDSKPVKIQGKQLRTPELQLGKKERVEEHKSTSFMLFNKNLYNSAVDLHLAVIFPSDYDLTQIKDLMKSTCLNLGLNYKLLPFPIKFQDSNSTIKTIQNIIRESEQSKEKCNLFWFILPNNFRDRYSEIKKMVLKSGIEKNSQVCLTSTLLKKGFNSILTKILLQIAAKVGNKLWVPKISQKLIQTGLLVVGIQTYSDSMNRSMNVLSYCSNTSKDFSSFYSNYLMTPKGGDKTHLNEIVLNCLSQYLETNKVPPNELIIIKNGSTKHENKLLLDTEVNEVKKTLQSAIKTKVNLIYVLLDKDTNQKFFSEKGREISNPSSGMLVNSEAVGKGFEFYLIAQQCNRGTVKPTFYKVVYSDSEVEEGVLEEFMYSQCFNYMNWTGSIKVPSVLQYAKKLSMFVGQYLNDKCVGEALCRHLYYI